MLTSNIRLVQEDRGLTPELQRVQFPWDYNVTQRFNRLYTVHSIRVDTELIGVALFSFEIQLCVKCEILGNIVYLGNV